jgi:hypothetical protein
MSRRRASVPAEVSPVDVSPADASSGKLPAQIGLPLIRAVLRRRHYDDRLGASGAAEFHRRATRPLRLMFLLRSGESDRLAPMFEILPDRLPYLAFIAIRLSEIRELAGRGLPGVPSRPCGSTNPICSIGTSGLGGAHAAYSLPSRATRHMREGCLGRGGSA